MKKTDTLRALALLALVGAAVAGLVVLSVNAPLREALGESLGRFRGWAWGPVVYALACLVLPGSLITLAAGSLFGVVVGTAVVSLASVTGASLAFWLGRYNLVVLGAGTAGAVLRRPGGDGRRHRLRHPPGPAGAAAGGPRRRAPSPYPLPGHRGRG